MLCSHLAIVCNDPFQEALYKMTIILVSRAQLFKANEMTFNELVKLTAL